MTDTVHDPDTETLPDWRPRPDLETAELANALEHIRRAAYLHWLGDAFERRHMEWIAILAGQALCGQQIEPPVDMGSSQYKARVQEEFERILEVCDDGLEHAATTVAPHEHDFRPDPDRTDTLRCIVGRCQVLVRIGRPHHPYRELKTPDGMLVPIDENLVTLIEELWEAGVRTYGSCEGGCARGLHDAVMPAFLTYHSADRDAVSALLGGAPGVLLHPGQGAQGDCDLLEWDGPWRCRDLEAERLMRQADARTRAAEAARGREC